MPFLLDRASHHQQRSFADTPSGKQKQAKSADKESSNPAIASLTKFEQAVEEASENRQFVVTSFLPSMLKQLRNPRHRERALVALDNWTSLSDQRLSANFLRMWSSVLHTLTTDYDALDVALKVFHRVSADVVPDDGTFRVMFTAVAKGGNVSGFIKLLKAVKRFMPSGASPEVAQSIETFIKTLVKGNKTQELLRCLMMMKEIGYEIDEGNRFIWNCLLATIVKEGTSSDTNSTAFEHGLSVLDVMKKTGSKPTKAIYQNLLFQAIKAGKWEKLLQLLAECHDATGERFEPSYYKLLMFESSKYALRSSDKERTKRQTEVAYKVLMEMKRANIPREDVHYKTLMYICSEHAQVEIMEKVKEQMAQDGIGMDQDVYAYMMRANRMHDNLDGGLAVMTEMEEKGLKPSTAILAEFIILYGGADPKISRTIFDTARASLSQPSQPSQQQQQPTTTTPASRSDLLLLASALIRAYNRNLLIDDALWVLDSVIRAEGLVPDQVTVDSLIGAPAKEMLKQRLSLTESKKTQLREKLVAIAERLYEEWQLVPSEKALRAVLGTCPGPDAHALRLMALWESGKRSSQQQQQRQEDEEREDEEEERTKKDTSGHHQRPEQSAVYHTFGVLCYTEGKPDKVLGFVEALEDKIGPITNPEFWTTLVVFCWTQSLAASPGMTELKAKVEGRGFSIEKTK